MDEVTEEKELEKALEFLVEKELADKAEVMLWSIYQEKTIENSTYFKATNSLLVVLVYGEDGVLPRFQKVKYLHRWHGLQDKLHKQWSIDVVSNIITNPHILVIEIAKSLGWKENKDD